MTSSSRLISEGRDEDDTHRKMPRTSLALMLVKTPLASENMLATIVGNPGMASRQTWSNLTYGLCGSAQAHSTSWGLNFSIGKWG